MTQRSMNGRQRAKQASYVDRFDAVRHNVKPPAKSQQHTEYDDDGDENYDRDELEDRPYVPPAKQPSREKGSKSHKDSIKNSRVRQEPTHHKDFTNKKKPTVAEVGKMKQFKNLDEIPDYDDPVPALASNGRAGGPARTPGFRQKYGADGDDDDYQSDRSDELNDGGNGYSNGNNYNSQSTHHMHQFSKPPVNTYSNQGPGGNYGVDDDDDDYRDSNDDYNRNAYGANGGYSGSDGDTYEQNEGRSQSNRTQGEQPYGAGGYGGSASDYARNADVSVRKMGTPDIQAKYRQQYEAQQRQAAVGEAPIRWKEVNTNNEHDGIAGGNSSSSAGSPSRTVIPKGKMVSMAQAHQPLRYEDDNDDPYEEDRRGDGRGQGVSPRGARSNRSSPRAEPSRGDDYGGYNRDTVSRENDYGDRKPDTRSRDLGYGDDGYREDRSRDGGGAYNKDSHGEDYGDDEGYSRGGGGYEDQSRGGYSGRQSNPVSARRNQPPSRNNDDWSDDEDEGDMRTAAAYNQFDRVEYSDQPQRSVRGSPPKGASGHPPLRKPQQQPQPTNFQPKPAVAPLKPAIKRFVSPLQAPPNASMGNGGAGGGYGGGYGAQSQGGYGSHADQLAYGAPKNEGYKSQLRKSNEKGGNMINAGQNVLGGTSAQRQVVQKSRFLSQADPLAGRAKPLAKQLAEATDNPDSPTRRRQQAVIQSERTYEDPEKQLQFSKKARPVDYK